MSGGYRGTGSVASLGYPPRNEENRGVDGRLKAPDGDDVAEGREIALGNEVGRDEHRRKERECRHVDANKLAGGLGHDSAAEQEQPRREERRGQQGCERQLNGYLRGGAKKHDVQGEGAENAEEIGEGQGKALKDAAQCL